MLNGHSYTVSQAKFGSSVNKEKNIVKILRNFIGSSTEAWAEPELGRCLKQMIGEPLLGLDH